MDMALFKDGNGVKVVLWQAFFCVFFSLFPFPVSKHRWISAQTFLIGLSTSVSVFYFS
ncbi:hypothetical protein BJX64DRAFT_7615 [Aspergillus heterothallicus]